MNLAKTWEKLMIAARIIASIDQPGDILVSVFRPNSEQIVAERKYAQRAVLKFATYT